LNVSEQRRILGIGREEKIMVLLISYDLNGHERPSAYAAVKEMIEDKAISSKKPLYSQWFVETNDSVQSWHDSMQSVTDDNDKWFINEVTRPRQGWFAKSIWEWLNERT
jgi:hypothetical protein